jgi:alanine racemase
MSRATRATIDTGALTHNLSVVRRQAPGARVMAVVKANAYGHGLATAVRALGAADAFAVACVDEALAVRAAGATAPVVLLEGAHAPDDVALAAREGFELVVHGWDQVEQLRAHRGPKLACWLKIDTGMHRLGFPVEDARAAHAALGAAEGVGSIALMTHLANSDERDGPVTPRQLAAFAAFDDLPGPRSIANSAGLLGHPAARADWVRPGLVLYGVSPFGDTLGADHGLRPAMRVTTRLIAVKTARMGASIGYGGRSTATEDMPIGIAAIGYGDGYPRHAPPGAPVGVAGRVVPLLGRVSMDMIAVDLRTVPEARVGIEVELWGAGLPVEHLARAADMIPYELLCGVTQRVRHEAV